jgi:nucleoside-diphosphate-sugar epimerase
MTTSLLVGSSGFIGSQLERSMQFSESVNSSSPILDFTGDLVVCAAPSAVKWIANADPESDLVCIKKLIARLERIKTRRFVLVSTVDVYQNVADANELSPLVGPEFPYGFNRSLLERWVSEKFEFSQIFRVGGVVGPGLKKNPVFDLRNNHNLNLLNANSQLQFLPIQKIRDAILDSRLLEIREMNLTAPPVSLGNIAQVAGITLQDSGPIQHYNVKTLTDAAHQGSDYWVSESDSWDAIRCYLGERSC